jgi:muramidase (phage lysozyme)
MKDIHPNLKAFLDMLAYAEIGPAMLADSDRGYDVIVGSVPGNVKKFRPYSDHPRIYVERMNSTAAGRYQILKKNYDFYKRELGLKGFWPEDQDRIALRLISECGATFDIIAGRIAEAIHKCRSRWASLPGAGYGQPEKSIDRLVMVYRDAGGSICNLF